MELQEILDKVGIYTKKGFELRQALNTISDSLNEAAKKQVSGTEKALAYLEQQEEKAAALKETIFILETYYVMLSRKKSDKKAAQAALPEFAANLKERIYPGSGYSRKQDPESHLSDIIADLKDSNAMHFAAAIVNGHADLLQATLYHNDPKGLKDKPLAFDGILETTPLNYVLKQGDVASAALLCEEKVKITDEDFVTAAAYAEKQMQLHEHLAQEQEGAEGFEVVLKDDFDKTELEMVGVLLKGGYPFNESVVGFLTKVWNDKGHRSLDYLKEVDALHDKNISLFRDALGQECSDLQFNAIIGNLDKVITGVNALDKGKAEDVAEFVKLLRFTAFSGRVDMARYLITTPMMKVLFAQDTAAKDIGDVVEQSRGQEIRDALVLAAKLNGIDVNTEQEKLSVNGEGREALQSSTDFIRGYVQQEQVTRYREGGQSYFAYVWDTNSPKANAIEAAMMRADTQREKQEMGAEEWLHYKQEGTNSVAEELANPRLGFFAATGYNRTLKKLETFRKERAEQEEEQQTEQRNGM